MLIVVTPRSRTRSVRLSLWKSPLVYMPSVPPLKVLPPSFGTRLIYRPLASLSAEIPPVKTTVSSTVAGFMT